MENNNENKQPTLEINDELRITSDGRLNLILERKYFKREGKGKNAPLSNEVAWQTVGYFGAGMRSLTKRLSDEDLFSTFSELEDGKKLLDALKDLQELLIEREERMYQFLADKTITLELHNVKSSKDGE